MARMTKSVIECKLDTLNMLSPSKEGEYQWYGDGIGYRLVFRHKNTGISDVSDYVRGLGDLATVIDGIINVLYRQRAEKEAV